MGKSTAEVMKLSEQGAIDSTTAINAVVMGMQKNFAGGMDAMSKTVPGLLSTIKDNAGQVMTQIGDQITEGLDLKNVLQNLGNFLTQFASVVKGAGIKTAIMGLIPPEATAAVFVLSGAIIAAAIPAMYAFGLSVWTAMAPLIPFIAAGAAIGLLAYEIWRNWEPLCDLFNNLWTSISTSFSETFGSIAGEFTISWDAIKAGATNLWDGIVSACQTAWGYIVPVIKAAAKVILETMTPLIICIAALAEVVNLIYANWEPIASFCSQLWESVTKTVTEAWNSITDSINRNVALAVKTVTEGWNSVCEWTTSLWNDIVKAINSAWDWICSLVSSSISYVCNLIGLGWNAVEEVTNSVWEPIVSTISEAWENIKGTVASGVNWVVSKMEGLLSLINVSIPSGLTNFFDKVSSNVDSMKNTFSGFSLGFDKADVSSFTGGAGEKPNTTFTGLHGGGGSGAPATGGTGGSGGSGSNSAEKELEKMEKKAKEVSKSIQKEWMQLTGTQMDSLEAYRLEEQTQLDESASANENYQRDVSRLNEIYAFKKKKILSDQQKNTNAIWDKALESATTYQKKLAEIGMLDGNKQVFDIKSNASDELLKMKNSARDAEQAFANLTNEEKLQTIEAMTATGTAFTIIKDGVVANTKELTEKANANLSTLSNTQISLAQDTANKTAIINQEMVEKLKDVHKEYLNWKDQLDKAYNNGNLNEYKQLLADKQSLENNDLKGKQSLMDTYADLWKKANHSIYEDTATVLKNVSDSLSDVLDKFAHGTATATDIFKSFAQSVIDSIIKIQAQALAAKITSGLVGIFGGGTGSNAWTLSNGTKLDSNFGFKFAGGGQVFGAGTGTSDSILARISNGEYVIQSSAVKQFGSGFFDLLNDGKFPAFATGGIVTGSSLSANRYTTATTSNNTNSGNAPKITFNITNNTGSEIEADNTNTSFDGENYICDVVLKKVDRSPAYKRNLRTALQV